MCACVCTLVWHLFIWRSGYELLITEACLLWRPNSKRKQLSCSCFSEHDFCSFPPPDHVTSDDGASNASYNSQPSNLLCKSTRWLSVYRAPFISSKPGFASIHAVVIFLAGSFGNLSSMGWLTKGLLFHPHHPPHPSFLYLEKILIKWLVSFLYRWLLYLKKNPDKCVNTLREVTTFTYKNFFVRGTYLFFFLVQNVKSKEWTGSVGSFTVLYFQYPPFILNFFVGALIISCFNPTLSVLSFATSTNQREASSWLAEDSCLLTAVLLLLNLPTSLLRPILSSSSLCTSGFFLKRRNCCAHNRPMWTNVDVSLRFLIQQRGYFSSVANKLLPASSKRPKTSQKKLTLPKAQTPEFLAFPKDFHFLAQTEQSCQAFFGRRSVLLCRTLVLVLLKDGSSQACLDHAVRMINRGRWSWWFIGGPTVTPRLPCGTTVPGFVLEQTTINNVVETFWWEEVWGRGFFFFFFTYRKRTNQKLKGAKKIYNTILNHIFDKGVISNTFFVTSDWSRIISVDKLMRG